MMDRYSDFNISRKQAQQICFAIIADIENFCEEHAEEFEEFLKSEEARERNGLLL